MTRKATRTGVGSNDLNKGWWFTDCQLCTLFWMPLYLSVSSPKLHKSTWHVVLSKNADVSQISTSNNKDGFNSVSEVY